MMMMMTTVGLFDNFIPCLRNWETFAMQVLRCDAVKPDAVLDMNLESTLQQSLH